LDTSVSKYYESTDAFKSGVPGEPGLRALAAELEPHGVIGLGVVFWVAAMLQKTFIVAAHSATAAATRNRSRGAAG
jgi:hypothetical protein